MNNRQKRKDLLKAYFTKIQGCIDNGYRVTFDGDIVTYIDFENGVDLRYGEHIWETVYSDDDDFEDMADLKKSELVKQLKERVMVCVKVDIEL
jgi:hypothetical protein